MFRMALYSEDECGDLLQDLMGIPTSAALAILKTPLKKQKELLDLYYQMLQLLNPEMPPTLQVLGDLPILNVGHDSNCQSFKAAKFSLPRLYTLLAAKIRGLHPEYELSLIDLVRPKKSLTLEIVALLINAIMFNKNCRSTRDEKFTKIDKLKEEITARKQKVGFERDVSEKNARTLNEMNDAFKLENEQKQERHSYLRARCMEYEELSQSVQQSIATTNETVVELSEYASNIIKLKERLESLNEQLLDPNLESNIKLTKQELEDEIQLNLSLKLRKQSAIKTEECHKSFGSLIEQASYLIIDDKKVIVQKEEAFSEYQTGKLNYSKLETEMDDLRREIVSLKDRERKANKEFMSFKTKQIKGDNATKSGLESLEKTKRELTVSVEALGEKHKQWVQLSSTSRSLTLEKEAECNLEDSVAQFIDEYNDFIKSVKKPCLILASSFGNKKSQLEKMSVITEIKFKGISDLLAATVQNIYAQLIKTNSGRNNFHCGGIEKVANIVQLLITTFNFIQEEHRMARVIDTKSISERLEHVVSDTTNKGGDECMPILQSVFKSLISKLNNIQLKDYKPVLVPSVSTVTKFPEFFSENENFSAIISIVSDLEASYDSLKNIEERAKTCTAKNSARQYLLDWITEVVLVFEELLLGGVSVHQMTTKNIFWGYAQAECIKQMDAEDEQLKEIYRIKKEKKLQNKKEAYIKQIAEKRKIEEELIVEQRRIEKEKLIEEQKRIEDERLITEKKKIDEEKQLEAEKIAEEIRIEEERVAEEERIKKVKIIEENIRKEQLIEEENRKEKQDQDVEVKQVDEQQLIEKDNVEEIEENIRDEQLIEEEQLTEEENRIEIQDQEDSTQKRKLRRETYTLQKPSKYRRVSEEADKKLVCNNLTYITETPRMMNEVVSPQIPCYKADSIDSEISFRTPKPVVVGKSSLTAARRKTYVLQTPQSPLIRNSTRRSSVVFTPELIQSLKRPSIILPHQSTPVELNLLLSKYSSRCTTATPRRMSKPRPSVLPSPMSKLLKEQLMSPANYLELSLSQHKRVSHTAKTFPSMWSEQDQELDVSLNSKASLNLFNLTPTKTETEGQNFSMYTPCAPRMAGANALVSLNCGQKLDYSGLSSNDNVKTDPAAPEHKEQININQDTQQEDKTSDNQSLFEADEVVLNLSVDDLDNSLAKAANLDIHLKDNMSSSSDMEPTVAVERDEHNTDTCLASAALSSETCTEQQSNISVACGTTFVEEPSGNSVACGMTFVEEPSEKSVACGITFVEEPSRKSVACGMTFVEEPSVKSVALGTSFSDKFSDSINLNGNQSGVGKSLNVQKETSFTCEVSILNKADESLLARKEVLPKVDVEKTILCGMSNQKKSTVLVEQPIYLDAKLVEKHVEEQHEEKHEEQHNTSVTNMESNEMKHSSVCDVSMEYMSAGNALVSYADSSFEERYFSQAVSRDVSMSDDIINSHAAEEGPLEEVHERSAVEPHTEVTKENILEPNNKYAVENVEKSVDVSEIVSENFLRPNDKSGDASTAAPSVAGDMPSQSVSISAVQPENTLLTASKPLVDCAVVQADKDSTALGSCRVINWGTPNFTQIHHQNLNEMQISLKVWVKRDNEGQKSKKDENK